LIRQKINVSIPDPAPSPANEPLSRTKQEQMFKAKPARKVIKVRPLKALKDMAK